MYIYTVTFLLLWTLNFITNSGLLYAGALVQDTPVVGNGRAEDSVKETPQSSNFKKKAWGNAYDPNMDSSSEPKTYMSVKWERPTDWTKRPNIQKVVGHFLPQPRPLPTCAS